MQERTIILLSCSRDKRQGGVCYDETARRLASSSALPQQWKALVAERKRISVLLRGIQGRLYNDDQAGGFRDLRGVNRSLVSGLDVGGTDYGKQLYWPAHKRYCGRFFVELDAIAPGFWSELNRHPIEILFVSGLYGLLLWDEVIQEYDCHLGDYVKGKEPKQTVARLWRPLLTDVLCEFIKTERAH